MDISSLDPEEKSKIATLLRERQNASNETGVSSIFKKTDEREEFLLGRKLDVNKMVQDEKAIMGETEDEFKARMKRRNMIEKMREDPMAIIQHKEQLAKKIALKKQEVHQKHTNKKLKPKFRDNSSSDSDDTDDILSSMKAMIAKVADSDDNIPKDFFKFNTEKVPKKKSKDNIKNERQKSKKRSHRRNSSSSSYQNTSSRKRSRSPHQRRHRIKSNDKKRDYKKSESKHNQIKNKLTKEEKEKMLEKMEKNAELYGKRCEKIRNKYEERAKREDEELRKLNMDEEFFFLESRRNRGELGSLQQNIRSKVVQNTLKKHM